MTDKLSERMRIFHGVSSWADEVATLEHDAKYWKDAHSVVIDVLEQRVEMTERALYNAINEGVAHAFLNLDDDSRRARVLTQEEVAAEAEEEA